MDAAGDNQLGDTQLQQMLRDRGLGNGKLGGELLDGVLGAGEQIEDGAAGRVGEGAPDRVGCRSTHKHLIMVSYFAIDCKTFFGLVNGCLVVAS